MKKELLLLALLLTTNCNQPSEHIRPPPVVTATRSVVMDVPLYYDYIGHGDANSSVQIFPQVSGILTQQKYTGGELIRTNDILFTVDPRPYEAALKKAESSLEQNLATLKYAKEKAESYTQLIKDDIVSQLDFDQALTDVLTLEAKISQSHADIQVAKLNLDWCTIRAPITGVTSISSTGVGTYVTAGSTTPLVTIKQSVPLSMNIYVPESHYLQIRALKQTGPVRVQAFSDDNNERIHEGTLNLIDNTMDKETGTIWMQATFPNREASMWPDEYFLIRVHLGILHNATVIPDQAIVKNQQGNQVYVIKENNTVEARSVTLGPSYQDLVVIKEGILPNETIVLAGQINVSNGTTVTIKNHTITPLTDVETECTEIPAP